MSLRTVGADEGVENTNCGFDGTIFAWTIGDPVDISIGKMVSYIAISTVV